MHRQHGLRQQTILDWLTTTDYISQQNDLSGRRQEGTGEWLLNTYEFQQWKNGEEQILFCPGIPGAGKTIMTSIVVDHLCKLYGEDLSVGIAFLYCNFRQQQEQQVIHLFSSLLKQFAQRQPSLPRSIVKLYEDHERDKSRPSLGEISTALQSVIMGCSKAFIIVDALDECSVTDGVLSRFLEGLFVLQAETKFCLFGTSRPILDIPKRFERHDCSILKIHAIHEDMEQYIDGHIYQVPESVREAPGMKKRIKTAIINAADGM